MCIAAAVVPPGDVTSHRRSNGLRPVALSTDNFYVDREQTPRDRDGRYDFESIEAIDLEQRRISLGPGERADGGANWQDFANTGESPLGSLGDKLQAALNAKKKQ